MCVHACMTLCMPMTVAGHVLVPGLLTAVAAHRSGCVNHVHVCTIMKTQAATFLHVFFATITLHAYVRVRASVRMHAYERSSIALGAAGYCTQSSSITTEVDTFPCACIYKCRVTRVYNWQTRAANVAETHTQSHQHKDTFSRSLAFSLSFPRPPPSLSLSLSISLSSPLAPSCSLARTHKHVHTLCSQYELIYT